MVRKRKQVGTELNTSSMFDMGFQLLAFFILTFKPNPVEGQISLRLPPPQAMNAPNSKAAGSDANSTDTIKGVETLLISVISRGGGAPTYLVGERPVNTIPALEQELGKIFGDKANPFEQVVVQVSSDVLYEDLMKVIEICTKQRLPDGSKLSKLSFVEISGGGG